METFPQEDFDISGVPGLMIGLSWDLMGSKEVDLDASCVFFDDYGRIVDAVFFNQLDIGYAIHSGDNKTGEGEGFDETIHVNFEKMKAEVSSFFIVINCHSGGSFLSVETAEAKIMDLDLSGQVLLKEVLIGCKGDHTGLIFSLCYRNVSNAGWKLREIGRVCGGRNFQDAEKEMGEELKFLVPEELSNEMKFDVNNRKKFNLKKGDDLKLEGISSVMTETCEIETILPIIIYDKSDLLQFDIVKKMEEFESSLGESEKTKDLISVFEDIAHLKQKRRSEGFIMKIALMLRFFVIFLLRIHSQDALLFSFVITIIMRGFGVSYAGIDMLYLIGGICVASTTYKIHIKRIVMFSISCFLSNDGFIWLVIDNLGFYIKFKRMFINTLTQIGLRKDGVNGTWMGYKV